MSKEVITNISINGVSIDFYDMAYLFHNNQILITLNRPYLHELDRQEEENHKNALDSAMGDHGQG
jgi:hypothetical protein